MRHPRPEPAKPVSPDTIARDIDRLSALPIADLRTTWKLEFRRDPPKGLYRDLLLRTLAWRIQEKAFGGHEKAILQLFKDLCRKREQFYQRVKAGTVIVRDFGGMRHTVTVMPDGYLWQEETFPSLSAIAKQITGTNWNGPRFFGLRQAGRASQALGSRREPDSQARVIGLGCARD